MPAPSREAQLIGHWMDLAYGIFQGLLSGLGAIAGVVLAVMMMHFARGAPMVFPATCMLLLAAYCATRIVAAAALVALSIHSIKKLNATPVPLMWS